MAKALKEENIRVTMELYDLTHHVVSSLGAEYESSKGTFPVQRYEMLKTMIKSAIQTSRPDILEKKQKSQKFGDAAEALRVKEEAKKELRDMSKEAIEANTTAKRREIEMIRSLETDYSQSKGLFPVRRYFVMKRMVKRRTRPRAETL